MTNLISINPDNKLEFDKKDNKSKNNYALKKYLIIKQLPRIFKIDNIFFGNYLLITTILRDTLLIFKTYTPVASPLEKFNSVTLFILSSL